MSTSESFRSVTDARIENLMATLLERAENAETTAVRKYAVISTVRTGSSLFCDGLSNTELLGWPGEWFNQRYIAAVAAKHKVKFSEYVDLLIRGTSKGGVFGVHIHMYQYRKLFRAGVTLGSLGLDTLYWVERRDKVAQAYSYAKALKTDLWSKEAEMSAGVAGKHVEVSADEVSAALLRINDNIKFFEETIGRANRRFIYEDHSDTGFESAVSDVLSDFGHHNVSLNPRPLRLRQRTDSDMEKIEEIRRLVGAPESQDSFPAR